MTVYFIIFIQLLILLLSIMKKEAAGPIQFAAFNYSTMPSSEAHYLPSLPVHILGIEFLWTIFMTRFVGPTISKKNPTREQLIAIKHNIIITRIKLAISGVTHHRPEN
jgi:hypothetical protein